MSLENLPPWLLIFVIFVVSFFFSLIAYFEKNISQLTKDNAKKMYVRGSLHSAIGGLTAVIVYAVQLDYFSESNFILKVSLSVMGAVLSDTLLLRARKEIGERDVK